MFMRTLDSFLKAKRKVAENRTLKIAQRRSKTCHFAAAVAVFEAPEVRYDVFRPTVGMEKRACRWVALICSLKSSDLRDASVFLFHLARPHFYSTERRCGA